LTVASYQVPVAPWLARGNRPLTAPGTRFELIRNWLLETGY
jgi:hypothetical protein